MQTTRTFDEFYACHLPLTFAAAFARTGHRPLAEDLVQETMLRAWRHFTHLNTTDDNAQRAWLLRAVRHTAIDAYRRRDTAVPLETETAEQAESPDETLRLDVARALSELEDTDREIALLRYFLEMNSREIGEVLGMPEGTVRRRLANCRERLARRLIHWDKEEHLK